MIRTSKVGTHTQINTSTSEGRDVHCRDSGLIEHADHLSSKSLGDACLPAGH